MYRYFNSAAAVLEGAEIEDTLSGFSATAAVIPGADSDQAVIIGDATWRELDLANGSLTLEDQDFGQADRRRAFAAEPCPGPGPVLVEAWSQQREPITTRTWSLHSYLDGQLLDGHGFAQSTPQLFEMVGAVGCLPDQSGKRHRVLLQTGSGSGWKMKVEIENGSESLTVKSSGLLSRFGFMPAAVANLGASLLVAQVGQDGPEVSQMRLLLDEETIDTELELVARDPLFNAPTAVVGGSFDADDLGDLIVLIPVSSSEGSLELFVQGVFGHSYRGKRVSGTVSLGKKPEVWMQGGGVPYGIWAADFNADGVDDLVLMEVSGDSWSETIVTQWRVYYMGRGRI